MPKQTDSIELTNSLQGTVEYTASQEIIPEEKILEQGSFTYTSNGERTENPSEGYDGFSQVAVNVNVQPVLQSKSVSYTENNDYTISPDDGYQGLSSVAVNVNVPQGGTEAPENDVEFIDYDGTIVYSYTAQEFLALDAMPANPTHEGLTAQGWNWTLADAKEYVGDYGGLVIGQMYITDDGKTRLYIDLQGERLSPTVGLWLDGTCDIDWGDGSTHSTMTASSALTYASHTYGAQGKYVIAFDITGTAKIAISQYNSTLIAASDTDNGSPVAEYYRYSVYKIEIGNNITEIYSSQYVSGIKGFKGLKYITIPKDLNYSGYPSVFGDAYDLKCFIGNSSFTNLSNTFQNAVSLKRVSFSKITANSIAGAFSHCYALKSIALPQYTSYASNILEYTYSLQKVFIGKLSIVGNSFLSYNRMLTKILIPATVTSIELNAFANVPLKMIKFANSTPPTISASNAFTNLPTDCVIYVPYSEDHSILDAYKTATNYPNPNTYTYVEY